MEIGPPTTPDLPLPSPFLEKSTPNAAPLAAVLEKKKEIRRSVEYKPSHEALKAWDSTRRAREANEKAVSDVMLANVEEKIESGTVSCNELLKYVKELARCQQEFAKSMGKLGNTLDERNHYGTLEHAVVTLKMHNINSCAIYEEHNKILIENIAGQLSQLVNEYSKQGSKIVEALKKAGKEYEQGRETTNKNFAAYLNAVEEYEACLKAGTIPSHDPWMAERVYTSSLQSLQLENEKCTTELESIFEKFLALEEKRIEATKDVLHVHISKQKLIFGKLQEGLSEFGTSVQKIDTVSDRQLLVRQNFDRKAIAQSHLQKLQQQIHQAKQQQPSASSKQAVQNAALLASLQQQHRELRNHLQPPAPLDSAPQVSQQFPPFERQQSMPAMTTPSRNSTDLGSRQRSLSSVQQQPQLQQQQQPQRPLNVGFRSSMEIASTPEAVMQPVKTGLMFRRTGKIMKAWKKTHCVLTSSGFLYMFTDKQNLTPKYTVPLKDVCVQPLPEDEDPNVFELVVNKDSFFTSAKYTMQAETSDSLTEWIDAIKMYSGAKK